MKKTLLVIGAACAFLAACAPNGTAPAKPLTPEGLAPAPAGDYKLDKSHASIVFSVDHIGFSHWTARFSRFDAALHFDPQEPAGSHIEASVDPASIDPDNPPDGFIDMLTGEKFLDAGNYPAMTFKSTRVELTGPNTAKVTGDFTLHGRTHPLVLDVVFNGGYARHPLDPESRIGFSAHGALDRSDYGMDFGLPPPGSTMGVSDKVDIAIEVEFVGPPGEDPQADRKDQ
ncbi:MAG TPA: YceI family protein [Parvularculaceae bacterium]|nr:YceI family protein [Parvularculaceae bacterium]